MRDILSRGGRATLSALTAGRLLVVLDYDGTLAPMASRPDRARMRGSTRQLLQRLARVVPCAVISGRARRDLRAALGDVPLVALVGNHGAEHSERVRPRRDVTLWRETLTRSFEGVRGVWIEDKGLSLSVQYRASPRKTEAYRAVTAAVARLRGARVFGGHDVVNIVSRTAPDKGKALCSLIGRHG